MLDISSEPLAQGTVIAGVYRLERPLGQGGMGAVWAARDATGARFALKVALGDKPEDRKQDQRLLREARAASRVRHPNVVPILAVVETAGGMPCLVMPLLEGESLRALLLRARAMPVRECARLFLGITAGLAAIHLAGIVHRDLKPENVSVVNGEPMVLDFGIAKEVGAGAGGETVAPSLTSTGAVIGTPYYMAPEQIFAERDVDTRADIWALGIMIYEALSGVLPTRADGFGQIMKRITAGDIAPVSSLVPAVPEPLSRLVASMLAKDRSARPTLDVVASMLAHYASAPALSATPVNVQGVVEPPPLPPSRRPALLVPGALDVSGSPSPNVSPARRRGVIVGVASVLAIVVASATIATLRTTLSTAWSGAGASESASTTATVAPSSDPETRRAAPSGTLPPSASLATTASAPPKRLPNGPAAPSASGAPTHHAAFDTGIGNSGGIGPESPRLFSAVTSQLPRLRPCFPSPTATVAWRASIYISWPKGGGRVVRFRPSKNGVGQEPAAESREILACLEKTFATFEIPPATGHADLDGGAAYMVADAGYRWRFGPAP